MFRITIFFGGFLCLIQSLASFLIYPRITIYQITVSLTVPVNAPNHQMFFDWGMQINYDLPSNLSFFYSPPKWAGGFGKREVREIDYSKYPSSSGVHPNDFTAGEFYAAFEDVLVSYGFHETCLLKSVCEISRNPFHDDEQNLITEIITFLLSPSMHQAFSRNESVYKDTYEHAEQLGFLNNDCEKLYPDCKRDLVGLISETLPEY